MKLELIWNCKMECKWMLRNNGIAKWNFNGLQETMELPNGIEVDSTKQWNCTINVRILTFLYSGVQKCQDSGISVHRCTEMSGF